MPRENSVTVRNGETFERCEPAPVAMDRFRDSLVESIAGGGRIVALFARPGGDPVQRPIAPHGA